MGGVAANGGPYWGTWDLNFPSSLGWARLLVGCCPAGEGPRGAALAPRAPLLLTLTFCLLPVGGGAQVHLRRHGQGGPGAHPGSPPHRRRPPSPNSRWGPRARVVRAQGRQGTARSAAGPRGTRRGAGPGAPGAEQLRRRAQLCQAAGHSALQRHERAARGGSPPTWTLFTVLGESLPYLLGNQVTRANPRRPAQEPAGRAARKPRRAAGHPGTCSPGR